MSKTKEEGAATDEAATATGEAAAATEVVDGDGTGQGQSQGNGAALAIRDAGDLQLVIDLEKAGAITPTSLDLPAELPFDQWEAIGRFLGAIDRRSRWLLGDWLNFGEDSYGEAFAQAVEDTDANRYDAAQRVTGLDKGTLMNIASVCRKVARSRRREHLPFAIHAEVAPLDPDDQVKWLDLVEEHGWSRAELRRQIRAANQAEPAGAEPAAGGGGLTISEQIEAAARLVWNMAQSTSDGAYLVPGEAIAQLGAALGED